MISKKFKRVKENKKRIITIRTKLITAIAATCILLLTINGMLIISNVNKNSNSTMSELMLAEAGKVSEEADSYFEKYITVAEVVATNPTVHDYLLSTETGVSVTTNENFDNVINILRKTQLAYSDVISSVYVAEESPSSYITSSKTIVRENVDLTEKAYYLTLKDGQTHVSEPYVDSNTQEVCVTISVPIKVDNQVIGEVNVDILINTLSQITANSKVGETGSFILLSNNNQIVYHKDNALLNKNLSELDFDDNLISAVKTLNTKELINFNDGATPYVGSVNAIGNSGWKLITLMPESDFSAATNSLILMIGRNSIIIGAVLLAIVFVVITKLTSPIKAIQKVADKLAQGDLDVDISVKSNDEIGLLASSIAHLIERLKKYIDYIDESSEVLNQFASGDYRLTLKNEYSGEFEKLKKALLNISTMQNKIIGDIKESSLIINSNTEQIAYGATTTSQGQLNKLVVLRNYLQKLPKWLKLLF